MLIDKRCEPLQEAWRLSGLKSRVLFKKATKLSTKGTWIAEGSATTHRYMPDHRGTENKHHRQALQQGDGRREATSWNSSSQARDHPKD